MDANLTWIKCSGCEEMIGVPAKVLSQENADQVIHYCDSCEWIAETAVDQVPDESEECFYCGRRLDDFSDAGCEYCWPHTYYETAAPYPDVDFA